MSITTVEKEYERWVRGRVERVGMKGAKGERVKNGFQIARGEGEGSQVRTIVGKIPIIWGEEKEKWLEEVAEDNKKKEMEKEKE